MYRIEISDWDREFDDSNKIQRWVNILQGVFQWLKTRIFYKKIYYMLSYVFDIFNQGCMRMLLRTCIAFSLQFWQRELESSWSRGCIERTWTARRKLPFFLVKLICREPFKTSLSESDCWPVSLMSFLNTILWTKSWKWLLCFCFDTRELIRNTRTI